jgi:esterase
MPTLAYTPVTAAGGQPTRWVILLHGLLGRGSNWRSFTRRLVSAAPGWGGVLVDLRLHGESRGFPGPHTVEAAAGDLDAVAQGLPGSVEAVVGHSLGGKVAMAWTPRRPGLRSVVVLDASPSPRPEGRGSESTAEVLAVLRQVPPVVASREAFVERVVAAGQPLPIAQWLAMNLERVEGGMALAVDLAGMEALLRDVFRRDDWAVVESPPPGVRFDFVLGGRSMTVDVEARARLERLAAAGRIGLTVLPEAGHWVHVDDPEATFRAVSKALS